MEGRQQNKSGDCREGTGRVVGRLPVVERGHRYQSTEVAKSAFSKLRGGPTIDWGKEETRGKGQCFESRMDRT